MKRKYFIYLSIYLSIVVILAATIVKLWTGKNDLKHENTVLYQRIDNLQNPYNGLHVFHFSLDDVIDIFKDLTENKDKYQSIFENETLSYFKDLYKKYGLVLSGYCYFENKNGFNLSMATDKFRKEFEDNADWLRFGFHGYNSNSRYAEETPEKASSDYNGVASELERIAGKTSIDKILRIHMFQGNKNVVEVFKEKGIRGLISADDDRKSYYFDEKESAEIRKSDYFNDTIMGLMIFPTDLRIEHTNDIENTLAGISRELISGNNILVFFTHEWALNKENKKRIEKSLDFAVINNYKFVFLDAIIELNK